MFYGSINTTLIPVKLFYLTFYAAIYSLAPYLSHFLQQRGFSSGDVSTILGVVPFVILIVKPLIGHYADKTGCHKNAMLLCLFVSAVFLSAIYFVNPIDNSNIFVVDENYTITFNDSSILVSTITHFSTYQFWIIMTLVVIANAFGLSPCYTIMDTVVMNLLANHPEDFGKQKMWMAVGSSIAIFTVSAIMDKISDGSLVNYQPSFVAYVTFLILASFCVVFVKRSIVEQKYVGVSAKPVGPILKRWSVQLFLIMTFFMGANYAKSQWMTVWYLKELGAKQLTVATAILFTSAATMASSYFSGIVIAKLGCKISLSISLFAFGLRNGLWIFVTNGWTGVPIEILTGIAVGLWFSTMVSYANEISTRGSEATMQSIVSGVFDGLGTGVGSLSSGWIYFYFGGIVTWTMFSIVTSTFAIIYFVITVYTERFIKTPPCVEVLESSESETKPEQVPLKPKDIGLV